jgi:hypothetical protein
MLCLNRLVPVAPLVKARAAAVSTLLTRGPPRCDEPGDEDSRVHRHGPPSIIIAFNLQVVSGLEPSVSLRLNQFHG